MSNTLSDLSVQQLKQALEIRERIEALEQELAAIVGGGKATSNGGRRTMSASARAKIAAAQRLRWAKQRKGKPGAKPGRRGKNKMSPAGRAAIAAAMRKRWAKAKASHKNSLAA